MYLYYTSESYLEPLYHWEPMWIHVCLWQTLLALTRSFLAPSALNLRFALAALSVNNTKPRLLSLANLTRAKALVPRAFGAQLALRAHCLVHKQYKTESLTKTIWSGPETCFLGMTCYKLTYHYHHNHQLTCFLLTLSTFSSASLCDPDLDLDLDLLFRPEDLLSISMTSGPDDLIRLDFSISMASCNSLCFCRSCSYCSVSDSLRFFFGFDEVKAGYLWWSTASSCSGKCTG